VVREVLGSAPGKTAKEPTLWPCPAHKPWQLLLNALTPGLTARAGALWGSSNGTGRVKSTRGRERSCPSGA